MQIIRDNDTFGLMMIPLFVDWKVYRCNVKSCTNKPSTIIKDMHPDAPLIGMCEDHYQETNAASKRGEPLTLQFVFDDFNAFKKEESIND